MIETLTLPKDPMELATLVEHQIQAEDSRRAPKYARWLIAHAYLTGCRHFTAIDPRGVKVSATHFVHANGKTTMPTEVSTLLSDVNRVQGALLGADYMPAVSREGFSLRGIRDKAVGQVILDSLFNEEVVDRVRLPFVHTVSYLGTAGITGHLIDHPAVGLRADMQMIHPRELYPFPSIGWDVSKQHGIVWQRVVPLKWLQDNLNNGRAFSEEKIKEMDVYESQFTDAFNADAHPTGTTPPNHYRNDMGHRGVGALTKQTIRVAKIREVWVKGPLGFVERYFVTCGRATLLDTNLSGQEVYCSVGVAKFYDTGDFDGAGLFDLLWSVERNFEHMVDSLIKNVKNLKSYPIAILPAGEINTKVVFKEDGDFRVMTVQPDQRWMYGGARPMPPQIWGPHNSGELPGRAAQYLRGVADSLSPVRDLVEEKGRIDSATGLNRLEEEIRKPLTVPSQQIAAAFTTVYRSVLRDASTAISRTPRPLPVKRIGLELAGAVIDWERGEARFPQNPLPDISSLRITIRQLNAQSEAAKKAEAIELVGLQLSTPEQFLLYILQHGIYISAYVEPERAAYESVVMDLLTLFNDGVAPAQIVVAPMMARPDLQLLVVRGFLSSPIVRMASVDVQNAIITYANRLTEFMGVPSGQLDPYDAMMIEKARLLGSRDSQQQPQLAGAI